jgi:hypothetical protein
MQKQMGWQLMLDSHTYIEKDGQKIGLLGVENWSTHLRFPKYGSLEKAINGFNLHLSIFYLAMILRIGRLKYSQNIHT